MNDYQDLVRQLHLDQAVGPPEGGGLVPGLVLVLLLLQRLQLEYVALQAVVEMVKRIRLELLLHH